MNFQGRWLIGEAANQRVTALEERLNSQVVSQVGQTLGQDFNAFQPWMTCKSRVAEAKTLPCVSGPYLSPKELAHLHEFLSTTDNQPLGTIGMPTSELQVLHDDAAAVKEFYQLVDQALAMIFQVSPSIEVLWKSLVKQVVPLAPVSPESKVRYLGSGISNHRFRGAVFTHPPLPDEFKAEELAINLVHELGHQALMVYQYADPLFQAPASLPVYSAIRKVHRPLVMSFHALTALTFMCEFTKLASISFTGSRQKYFERRLQEINFDFQVGLTAMDGIEFTAFGNLILNEMKSVLRQARYA